MAKNTVNPLPTIPDRAAEGYIDQSGQIPPESPLMAAAVLVEPKTAHNALDPHWDAINHLKHVKNYSYNDIIKFLAEHGIKTSQPSLISLFRKHGALVRKQRTGDE